MTGTRQRAPTNKYFKEHFQGLASTRVKKGHLNNQEKKASDNAIEIGTLVRVNKKKFTSNGWEVKVGSGNDSHTYKCTYDDLSYPEWTETKEYYVPKKKTRVRITIDKKSKQYNIVKILDLKNPFSLYDNKLTISTNNDTDTQSKESSVIEVENDKIKINSKNIVIDNNEEEIDLIESNQNLNDLQKENETIKDEVSNLKEENKNLLQRIEILEEQINQEDSSEGE